MGKETARAGRWKTCYSCGRHNGEWEARCEKCGRRLSEERSVAGSASVAASQSPVARSSGAAVSRQNRGDHKQIAPRPPVFPEHLRRQLQDRVERYRSRQGDGTPALPFEETPEPSGPELSGKVISFPAPSAPIEEKLPIPHVRPHREFRATAAASRPTPQAALDFHSGVLPEQVWRARPVAPLRLRLAAHAKDLQLIAGAVLLFLAALLLIPHFDVTAQPTLLLVAGVVCGSLLLTLLYGLLFVWGAGVTPGMKSTGLRLVSFYGQPAPRRQRLWRILGTVVSAGSFLIGFLWAIIDEENLYWHDHISRTYLTLSDT